MTLSFIEFTTATAHRLSSNFVGAGAIGVVLLYDENVRLQTAKIEYGDYVTCLLVDCNI